ncbi:MAG: glycosyltransferase family 4 protein [Desulfovibrio aminophilus]|uniref:glycosyltransferase family 4 protein n=1 Tax=Desulfovibrio aminophilus TaxID=81425 RepID=UPI002A48FA73|nr:glycosyltransferase family 4 protein [Desulfovibrionaceae bacterium]
MKTKRLWGTLDPFLEPGPILGRRVANAQFLRFLLEADPYDEYHFFLADRGLREGLAAQLERLFPDLWGAGRLVLSDRRRLPEAVAASDFHCFHQSDCILRQPSLARLRNAVSRRIFPITGTTHSLSYVDYPARFLSHLWPGTTARDCIICTSRCGLEAVSRQFEALRDGFGLDKERFPAPRLERIPLGLDPDEFVEPSRQGREEARLALGLPQGSVLTLVFGRIAHYSKMDLLPLLRAFQRIFGQGADRNGMGLVLAGWVDEDDDFPQTLRRLAANIGLSLFLFERPDPERKAALFEACDIFASIADNPQETFGLTLLEAAAAGLPVVASDYDGYKDLVEHGTTGWLVPTTGLSATPEADLLAPLLPDNQYHLLLSQGLAVDTGGLAEAIGGLAAQPRLRLDMGRAGRKRVLEQFSWTEVIRRHVALWDELNALPVDEERARAARHPLHPEFGGLFGHYPTRTLEPGTLLTAGRTGQAFYRGQDFPLIYAGLENLVEEAALKTLVFLARKPVTAGELERRLGENAGLSSDRARFLLVWALKHDLLENAA